MFVSTISPKYHAMKYRDIDSLHRDIWNFFPGRKKNDRSFIFRVSGRGYTVYSSTEPCSRDGWDIETRSLDLNKVSAGTQLEMRSLLNATVRRFKHDHDIVLDRIQKLKQTQGSAPSKTEVWDSVWLDWFRRSEKTWGFVVNELSVGGMVQAQTKNHHFNAYDVQGIITVTDPVVFAETTLKGLGDRRDRGCGLMLIKRAQ